MQDAFREVRKYPCRYISGADKAFQGIEVMASFKTAGSCAVSRSSRGKILLARYFYNEIKKVPGFEVGPFPDLSVVTYRYLPEKGDPEEFNSRLVDAVQKDGRIFISSTMVGVNILSDWQSCLSERISKHRRINKVLREKADSIISS